MSFSHRRGRVARRAVIVAGVTGAAALSIIGFANQPAAGAFLAAVQSAVTCASTGTTACLSSTNSSSGIAVLGTANTGIGLRGSSNSNAGVKGTSTSSYGVYGDSTKNIGVAGVSTSGYGVAGSSSSGAAGVIGTSAENAGVLGKATDYGNGVFGQSSQGFGVYGTTTNGTGTAIFGYESSYGNGVYGESAGGGVGGFFESGYEAVVGQSGGYPLVGRNAAGTGVFYVDDKGDIIFGGGLMQFTPSTHSGALVTSFSAKLTLPTVEDTGTAQLVNGAAAVPLDRTFAGSIEPTVAYRVFLTPGGDTRGLYVAAKTAGGFLVREAQGGRSTVNFDYRIVATALGQAGQRMALTRSVALPPSSSQAPLQPPRALP